MKKASLFFCAVALSFIAMGCARNDGKAALTKSSDGASTQSSALTESSQSSTITFETLSKITTSSELYLDGYIDDCDTEVAVRNLNLKIDTSSIEDIQDLWANCQTLYACSPVTAEALNTMFDAGDASIRIGYADLESMKLPHTGNSTHGIYIPGTDKIILDIRQNTPKLACDSILNQIIHRFDTASSLGGSEEAFEIEYEAHWYQAVFLDELSLLEGDLGTVYEGLRFKGANTMYISSLELHNQIITGFGFNPNPEYANTYGELPREKKFSH